MGIALLLLHSRGGSGKSGLKKDGSDKVELGKGGINAPAKYNTDELKDWIIRERAMGTSDQDIKGILKHHTGWTASDVEAMFAELRKG